MITHRNNLLLVTQLIMKLICRVKVRLYVNTTAIIKRLQTRE